MKQDKGRTDEEKEVDGNVFDSCLWAAVEKKEEDVYLRVSVAKHLINDIIVGANDYFYECSEDTDINTLYKKKADKIDRKSTRLNSSHVD